MAVSKGAKALVPEYKYSAVAKEGTTYVAPQVLVNVDHSMKVMMDETLCVKASYPSELLCILMYLGVVVLSSES